MLMLKSNFMEHFLPSYLFVFFFEENEKHLPTAE